MARSLLGQRYEMIEPVGAGAMATVWRAHDRRLKREVAVKTLSDHLVADREFRERFEREALHVASLSHPNIVTVHDTGVDHSTYFIVMELVEGESLEARLELCRPYMDIEDTLVIGRQILAALSHAHGHGIVHRDIKPGNILITPEGRAKVADFGVAKAATDRGTLTMRGIFVGTAAYAAPEQLSGRPVTPATDLYSLGCLLYRCLVGHPPFEAEVVAGIVAQHLEVPPRRPRLERPETPLAVEAAILRALEKQPGRRFGSAAEMSAALTTGPALSTVTGTIASDGLGSAPAGAPAGARGQPPGQWSVSIVDDHPIVADSLVHQLAGAGFEVASAVAMVEDPGLELDVDAVVCDLNLPGRSGPDAVAYLRELGTRVLATSGVAPQQAVLDVIVAGAAGYVPKTAAPAVFIDAVTAVADGGRFVSQDLATCLLADADSRPLGRGDLGSLERDILKGYAQGDTADELASGLGLDPGRFATLLDRIWEVAGKRRSMHRLTAREREVVALVARGLSHKAIARELGIATVTVPDYLKSVKRKWDATHPSALDVTPMTACRRFAEELGLT
jgi:serine/threonine protein kinase/DNA-binding CsgD family transcriptional regulator